jgi:hypothetical protein
VISETGSPSSVTNAINHSRAFSSGVDWSDARGILSPIEALLFATQRANVLSQNNPCFFRTFQSDVTSSRLLHLKSQCQKLNRILIISF